MYYKKDDEFLNMDSDIVETAKEIDEIELKHNAELSAEIQQYFTPLEIETMKYIAQGLESKEIAQIYKVTKSTIERRKEYIIEKANKYIPEMVINKKQILTIKNIVYHYKLYDDNKFCIISESDFEKEKERLHIKFLNDFFN